MKYIAIFLIKVYQHIPGSWHGSCKFQPTCSEYAIGCFRKFGFIKGLILSTKRILRCNPINNGGYDPIPISGGKNGKDK